MIETVQKADPIDWQGYAGKIKVPASKSHTIRALLIAAFARGRSRLVSPLVSEDTLSCRRTVEVFGAQVHDDGADWIVEGLVQPVDIAGTVNVGNSGTTLYLSAALSALFPGTVYFDGDEQIRKRSATPLLDALGQLGAIVESVGKTANVDGCAPFGLRGPISPQTIEIDCPVSQYLSGLLLAAPLMQGGVENKTIINVKTLNEAPYVDLTLNWLDFQCIEYERQGWQMFSIPAAQHYKSFTRMIPGDWSSATFFFAAAAITGVPVVMEGLDLDDVQGDRAVLNILDAMGCRWNTIGNDTAKSLEFKRIAKCLIAGGEFDLNSMPDALPAMAAVACFADGETRLVNVPQARMKETDRISVMCSELSKLGAEVQELPDGLVIRGNKGVNMHGALVDGHADHRVVMALAVAALGCQGETVIDSAEAVAVTFPDFFDKLRMRFSARL